MPEDEDTHRHEGLEEGAECLLCPICVLLQALTTARPDVTRHLLAATRELTLALKAVVDEHAQTHERPDEPLRRIKIE